MVLKVNNTILKSENIEYFFVYSPQQITALNYVAQICKVRSDLIQSQPCDIKLLYL
jgi:hypothetical protein